MSPKGRKGNFAIDSAPLRCRNLLIDIKECYVFNMILDNELKIQVSSSNEGEIPLPLREYGEIPKGYVPVYLRVNIESLDHISRVGLRTIDNRASDRNETLERIFEEARIKSNGITVTRKECIFALPRHPQFITYGLPFWEGTHTLLEAMVDPSECIVVDGELFTEAGFALANGDEKNAEEEASDYWSGRKALTSYLAEGHDGNWEDYSDYNFPEVLIPRDIPTSRIRLIPNYVTK
jgi:hypothetical protein